MIEFDVDMSYLLECDELDKVVLNDECGEHEPMEFVPKDAATVGNARASGIATREQEAIVCDFLRKINPDREWAYLGEVEHAWISSMVNAIAATVGGEANVRGD